VGGEQGSRQGLKESTDTLSGAEVVLWSVLSNGSSEHFSSPSCSWRAVEFTRKHDLSSWVLMEVSANPLPLSSSPGFMGSVVGNCTFSAASLTQ
jgi:hypothetical protein